MSFNSEVILSSGYRHRNICSVAYVLEIIFMYCYYVLEFELSGRKTSVVVINEPSAPWNIAIKHRLTRFPIRKLD